MVDMTMETFSVSFWGGWAPHWLPKRFNVDFSLMLGWKSAPHTTIFLHSEFWQDLACFPLFQNIVDNWTQVNGMTSALVIASRLVCSVLQIPIHDFC